MFKVIVIDDEPLARKVILDYLSANDDLTIVAECSNGYEGLKAINQYLPDLVFLDIQMPKISGLELLELLDEPPAIIFTTAFDEYAIKAFEANAIDYLLKPFSSERFEKAIARWSEQRQNATLPGLHNQLIKNLPAPVVPVHRIVVKSGHNIRIIPLEEVLYIEAYDDYIKIHIKNDCFLKKQTMQQTEQLLDDKKFIRVHRSYIVNVSEITRIEPQGKESYLGIMRDGTPLPLSKTGYGKLKSLLGI
ncbi:MAG: LytTR family transcriptional regulator DNA-binding domain-containing protein [Bacteroidota bacterium]|nr:LytTR family transcriptional regulator DNA-binding domain-containing protein [Bacteroidota bacterium]